MNIGERIKQLRKQKNINQSTLASVMRHNYGLGTDRVSVSKWETGFCTPGTDALRCLAHYFDVSTDYLISGASTDVNMRRIPLYNRNYPQNINADSVVPPYDCDADFCIVACDDCMRSAGIVEGARVFVKRTDKVCNGDVVMAWAGGRVFICRYYSKDDAVLLMNDDFCNEPNIYHLNEKIRIEGKVVSVQYIFG